MTGACFSTASKGEEIAFPFVSIGMPAYNGAAAIGRALDSLVAQDYPNIEVVICDDASSDATPQKSPRRSNPRRVMNSKSPTSTAST